MRDAPRFDALPAAVPDPIRRLLRRCLEKNPDKRLDSMAVARLEIDEASATPHATIDVPAGAASAVAARRGTRLPVSLRAVLAGVLLIGVGVGGHWIGRRTTNASASLTPTSLEMGLAPAESLGPLALFARPSRPSFVVTRDGGRVVFAGATKDSTQLFVRAFNTTDAVAIDGTKGAQTPFLSPDDKWVGFLADGVLRKIPLAGGPVSSVADLTAAQAGGSTLVPSAVNLFGASWGDDGMIVFGRYSDGLWQVPAAGGTPSRLTAIDSSPDAASHRLPHHLPEGRGLLLTVASAPPRVAVLPNGSKEPRVLIESATDGRYIASGHIAFTRDGLLMAVPFDLDRLIVTGPAIALVENVLEARGSGSPGANTGAAQFDVSSSGTLVYASGGTFPLEPSRLVWVDRLGRLEPIDAPVGSYIRPRLSSDGRRLVVTYRPQGPRDPSGIAVFDFDRKALRRLTAKGEWGPLWSSDGAEVFFKQTDGIGRTRVDGSVPAERIHTHHGAYPHSVSADGSSLVFQTIDAETGSDLWLMSLRTDRTTRPLLRTPANESWGEIRPMVAGWRTGLIHPDDPRYTCSRWKAQADESRSRLTAAIPRCGREIAASCFSWPGPEIREWVIGSWPLRSR
jgi:Tol biopolymer transport system component